MGLQVVTWDQRASVTLPAGWDPVPFRLTNGALIVCPYDGVQPYIVQPRSVKIADNIAWAKKMRSDYIDYQKAMATVPNAETAALGFRVGQAQKFAAAVGQSGQFDYQRPPGANLFVSFYTSFASYDFGVLGYCAGFTMEHLMEGGGWTNWLHASWDRVTHWGHTRMQTSGAEGLTTLNEWCIRRAFQDCQQGLVA
jgi:hypothetical protein